MSGQGKQLVVYDYDGDETGFVIVRLSPDEPRFGSYQAAKAELIRRTISEGEARK